MDATFVRCLILLVLCRALTASPRARGEEVDAVDSFINQEMERRNIPGLSLAIVRNGRVAKAQGYGFADIDRRIAAAPTTAYQLASATKPFTATAVLLLVEDGKLRLDDPIDRYLHELPSAWGAITVRQLLTHTSGLPNYLSSPNVKWEKSYTPPEIVATVAEAPLNFPPGAEWQYSNTGFVLLAMIVESVDGRPYDEFLTERVFRPLGMTSTRRATSSEPDRDMAAGYQLNDGKIVAAERLNPTLWNNGDGGLVSTVGDLAKFDAAIAAGRVLRKPTLAQAWADCELPDGRAARTMFDTGYGFGWFVDYDRGRRFIWHSGGRPGSVSVISRFLDDRITVIILANRDGWNPVDLSRSVAGRFEPSLTSPRMLPARHDDDPELTRRLLAALSTVAYGQGDKSMMTLAQQAAISSDGNAELSTLLEGRTAFDLLGEDGVESRDLRRDGAKIERIRYYGLRSGDKLTPFSFFLTGEGKVAWIQRTND